LVGGVVAFGDAIAGDEGGDATGGEVLGDGVAFFDGGEDAVAASGEDDEGLAGGFALGGEDAEGGLGGFGDAVWVELGVGFVLVVCGEAGDVFLPEGDFCVGFGGVGEDG